MKIGGKLFLTYFLLIGSIFIVTSISFHFISARILINETKQQLQKEAKVISQLLKQEELSNKSIRAKLVNRRALTISERLTSSKTIIVDANKDLIYTDMTPASLKQYMQQGNAKKFVSETVPILDGSGNVKGYAVLVERIADLQKLNNLMRKSQLISLLISAVLALLLGHIFQRNLTKPIRMLAETMRNFSMKGENQEVVIETNDEIKELADSFNALSRKIKQYDTNQKSFFQNASHELKTPLMAIQGNAELILDKIVTGAEAEESLNVIIRESQRLKAIVDRITYLAKLENSAESFDFKLVPFDRVLTEAVKSVEAIGEQSGLLINVENTVMEPVRIDEEKIKRALINLLGNALRYAETEVVVSVYRTGSSIVVEVKDDGAGFKPGEETKVFDRFYSGADGGSGIGLAITKAIVEGHKGTITAFQNEPKGAAFRIELGIFNGA